MSRPDCFPTDSEWVKYVDSASFCQKKLTRGIKPVVDFCEDCDVEYQRKAIAAGTCLHNACQTEDEFEKTVIHMVALARAELER